MKKMMKLTVLALVLLVTLSAGSVLAADADLTVNAEVLATCTITAGTLDFGPLDPVAGGPVTVTNNAAAVVTCTNGDAYTLSDNAGVRSNYTMSDGTNLITYTLTYATNGTGTGAAQNISIKGDIAAVDYTTKPAGTYSDTVQLTVTP